MSAGIDPPPAPGEDGSIALALVNTEIEPRGRPLDLLPDDRALARWMAARGLARNRRILISEPDLDRMRRLRAAIRAAFTAKAAGQRPSRAVLRSINDASALVPCSARVRWDDRGPRRETRWPDGLESMDVALAKIATDAIETLSGDSGERLRRCEAHGCNRLFIADHRRRRWCSRACGDRVRVARHYRKRRAGSG
jgi:predicted RNA-binding Zn ribbon-like protein